MAKKSRKPPSAKQLAARAAFAARFGGKVQSAQLRVATAPARFAAKFVPGGSAVAGAASALQRAQLRLAQSPAKAVPFLVSKSGPVFRKVGGAAAASLVVKRLFRKR